MADLGTTSITIFTLLKVLTLDERMVEVRRVIREVAPEPVLTLPRLYREPDNWEQQELERRLQKLADSVGALCGELQRRDGYRTSYDC